MRGHGSFGLKKLLYKFYELREAVRGLRVAKITRFGPPNAFSTAFGLVFEVLAARKCKGVFATYEAEMNHADAGIIRCRLPVDRSSVCIPRMFPRRNLPA